MSGEIYSRLVESHGYAVLCTEAGGYRYVVGGFSALDSAENFAQDPRTTRYPCGLSDAERADLFARFEREVIVDVAR